MNNEVMMEKKHSTDWSLDVEMSDNFGVSYDLDFSCF